PPDGVTPVAPQHIDTLAASVAHHEWYVVRNVIWIMGRVGPPALPHIRKGSSHREPRVRREAVRSLAQIGGPEAVKGLVGYLYDRDESVFREAVAKFVGLHPPDGAAALRAAAGGATFAEREAESLA